MNATPPIDKPLIPADTFGGLSFPPSFPSHPLCTLGVVLRPGTCPGSQGTLRFARGTRGSIRDPIIVGLRRKFPREHMCTCPRGSNSWRSSTGAPLETSHPREISHDSFLSTTRLANDEFVWDPAGNICRHNTGGIVFPEQVRFMGEMCNQRER